MPRGLQVSKLLGVGSQSHCFTVHKEGEAEQSQLRILPIVVAPAAMP